MATRPENQDQAPKRPVRLVIRRGPEAQRRKRAEWEAAWTRLTKASQEAGITEEDVRHEIELMREGK